MALPACPGGFTLERVDGDLLYASTDLLGALREAELTRLERWSGLLERAAPGPGRGGTARVELPGRLRVVLKKMRRGGLACFRKVPVVTQPEAPVVPAGVPPV